MIISNHIGSPNSNQDTSNLYRANLKTMLDVFPNAYVFPTEYSKSIQNIILAAIKGENNVQNDSTDILEKKELVQMQENSTLIKDVSYADYLLDSSKIKIDDVPVLTDQYAPVESLLNPLSSKPYSIEEQDNTNTNIKEKDNGNDAFKITFSFPIAFMAIVLILWGFSLNRIWKKNFP